MIFAPKPLGNIRLDPETLKEDKKNAQKIGPCGIGEKAIYLNSFYIDRYYYATWTDVRRCFKRVAMSRGGYTGKGIFGSMPYLVVQFSNGQEKQCNFKYEEEVDRFLEILSQRHPEIPTHSREAEERLRKAKAREEARYLRNLSPKAQASVARLQLAEDYLDENPRIGDQLSLAARRKRSVDGVRASNLAAAFLIFLAGMAGIIFGLVSLFRGNRNPGMYSILFGVAAVVFTGAAGILPTARKNRRSVQKDWDAALGAAQDYISRYDSYVQSHAGGDTDNLPAADMAADVPETLFPVPAQYAHRIVLERMIRMIREGKTDNIPEAFELMKQELHSLDHTRTVSQKEYDEIVTIKPMFRVMDYQ